MKCWMYVRESDGPEHRLEANSLSQGAWALQEKFVATAVLHCARQRLCWECRSGSIFEDGTKRIYHPFLKGFDTHSALQLKGAQVDIEMWYTFLENYSQRALTYTSDKLAAIAGLANEFEEQGWGREYIAGLWKEDLLRGLLWSPMAKYHETREHFPHGILGASFPSWSWASFDSTVIFSTGMSKSFQRVVTVFDSKLEAAHVILDEESKTAINVEGSISFEGYIMLLSEERLSS